MYDDVLVPTDGSDTIETVIDHTARVTTDDGTVHVLYVIDDQAFLTLADEMREEVLTDLREDGAAAIRRARQQLEEHGYEVTTSIREGKPSEEIVAYVSATAVDLVTMGTRGDDYTENMFGSTAQSVVMNSPVPVLTVTDSE